MLERNIENKLILLCARSVLSEQERKEVLEISSGKIDWEYIYDRSRVHSILPLVFKNLAHTPVFKSYETLFKKWKDDFQLNAAHNVMLSLELINVFKKLAEKELSVLPIKGAALAVQAYKDLNLRRFTDIDLLCHKNELEPIIECLKKQGFELNPPLTRLQMQWLIQKRYNLALKSLDRQIIIELHWHIVPEQYLPDFSAETFWTEFSEVELLQNQIKTLSAENHLLLLCIHGSKHLWTRLAWICDVAEMIKSHRKMKWELIYSRLSTPTVKVMFHLGLLLATRLLEANVPSVVLQKASSDARAMYLSDIIALRLFQKQEPYFKSRTETLKFNWHLRQKLGDKFAYLKLLTEPTDTDFDRTSLPASLDFLYYLLRPLRLMSKRRKGLK